MRRSLTRLRATAILAGACGLSLVLAGCAGGAATPEETGAAAGDGTFPVSIDTAYGEVTMEQKPENIVVLTSSYFDLLAALDEKPTTWNTGFDDAASFVEWYPWLEGTFDGEPDASLLTADSAPSAEAIAALDPDLILTDVWNVDESLYEQLSQVAPTYVGLHTDTQTSWQDDLASIAALTGHDQTIVDDVEAELATSFAAAQEALPGLKDATFQVPVFADEQFWLSEYANDAMTGIGLVPGDDQPADGVTAADVDAISMENIERLNADVVFFASRPSGDEALEELYGTLEADPRLAALPAAQNGTVVYLSGTEWTAVNGGTPASYQWWLERVVPRLEGSAQNRTVG